MKTAGITGCKIGWLLVSFRMGEEKYQIIENTEALKEAIAFYDRIFIYMPIGLEDVEYTRSCDDQLRKELGAEYADSVINPPIRPALDAPSYAEANMTSFEYTEKKLSLQAWNITPKIKTINALLCENEGWKDKVLESHPELLFQKMNGGMIYQKKNLKKGIRHRLELILKHEAKADDFFREIKEEWRRAEVGEDDIVDAMILAWYAKKSERDGIRTIPEEVQYDSEGLPKAIHFV